jgi:16S rRNA (guanine527-N7)-methyltransferase
MTSKDDARALLNHYANEVGFDGGQEGRLFEFLSLLRQWNGTHNLTSIVDWSEMVTLHVFDALTLLPFVHGKSFLDVGSGAGIPGIPLAIARADLQVHSIDSRRKKIQFQILAGHALGIRNFYPIHSRVEQYQSVEKFDTLACRAFSSLEKFVASSTNLCKPSGRLLAMKGAYPTEELGQLNPDIVDVVAVHELRIPGRVSTQRHLIEMRLVNSKLNKAILKNKV